MTDGAGEREQAGRRGGTKARRRRREARLRLALHAAAMAEWEIDLDAGTCLISPRLAVLFGYPPGREVTLGDLRARCHPDDVARARELGGALREPGGPSSVDHEFRIVVPDGGTRWLHARGGTLRDADGRATGAAGVVMDVTGRKAAEERQSLLLAEIDHRAKNMLATIQAVVKLTQAGAGSVDAYVDDLLDRLRSLARTHELLARGKWERASLHRLLREEFEAYLDGARRDRFAIASEDSRLGRKAALTLSLAVHELVTNAVEHGALSVPEGWVAVETGVEDGPDGERLRFSWRESGGPPVRRPARRGFGSLVIERSIAHQLRGHAALLFEPDGLRCDLAVPLDGGPG